MQVKKDVVIEKDPDIYPLTHAQKRIYYDDLLHPGTSVSTQAFVVRYKQILDKSLLEKAINCTIQKNQGFRIRIMESDYDPEPRQFVAGYVPYCLEEIDFSGADGGKKFRSWLDRVTHKPIKIINCVLFYFCYINFGNNESGYYLKFHHAASDGWSYPLIFSEIDKIYLELEQGLAADNLENPPYLNYVLEEIDYLRSSQLKKDKTFWHKYMQPIPKEAKLTSNNGNPDLIKGEVFVTSYPNTLLSQMLNFCEQHKTSLFKLFLSALSTYIAGITSNEDHIIGAANHNRREEQRHQVIGMFVSSIPFRLNPNGNQTFLEFVTKTGKDVNFILKNHQWYPYNVLAPEITEITGDSTRHLLDYFISAHGDVAVERYTYEHIFQGYVVNTLSIHLNYNNKISTMGELEVEYEHQLEQIGSNDIRKIHYGLVNVLTNALADPNQLISKIELLSPGEKEQVLFLFNETSVDYPKNKTIHQLFEARADQHPDSTALVFENKVMTYKEIEEKANRLAHVLRERGVQPNNIVGVMVSRSFEMMTALLAVLKAGGAYVPIDPGYPIERIKFYMKDSQARLILTQKEIVSSLVGFETEPLDLFQETSYSDKTERLENINFPTDLAYVIFTSGSTGLPKGVMIRHRSAVNFFKGMTDRINFAPGKTIVALTTVSFDIFLLETLLPVSVGMTVVIANEAQQKDPQLLQELLVESNINILQATPSRLKLLFASDKDFDCLKNVEAILIGGEAVPEDLVKTLKQFYSGKIIDVYGPTETTVWSTLRDLTDDDVINIGKPIANTQIYIVDKYKRPLPIGAIGELYIGGDGVAAGYLNRVEMTDERFIPNPFPVKNCDDRPFKEIYQTGDLSRWLPNGEIDFLGRIDHQVKIRGFRIETGEIEIVISKQPGIEKAVVVARQETGGEKYLCGYFVADHKVDIHQLEKNLSENLLDYMIPSYLIQIDEIPLTPNGKVDRKALPAPSVATKGVNYIAPRNSIEKKLTAIWSKLLSAPSDLISIDDNFFKLGGHSLKAANMMAMIHKDLHVKVQMHQVFDMPTIRKMGEFIAGATQEMYTDIPRTPDMDYYPQSSAQKRLFFMAEMDPNSILYNIPVMDIYHRGINKEKLEETVRTLILRHESLRTSFHTINGEPVQRINNDVDFQVEHYIMREDGMIYSNELGKEWTKVTGLPLNDVVEHFVRPFDLKNPPLIRVGLIEIGGSMQILMADVHHIVSDGVSMIIILEDMWSIYDGKYLPELNVRYRDYSQWLHSSERKDMVKKQEAFWLKEFAGGAEPLNLPTDRPRPPKRTFNGDTKIFDISVEDTQKLNLIAKQEDQTLFMLLFSAFNVLLAKLSGQDDITIGTVVAGRNHIDLHKVVGMFVDTLVLRNFPLQSKTFRQFMKEVKDKTLTAFDNQEYPFESLVKNVAPRQDASRNPLFDVLFELENEDDRTEYLLEILMLDDQNPYQYRTQKAKFDLTLIGVETKDGIRFSIEFNTSLFDPGTIDRFIGYYRKIINSVGLNFNQKLSEIEIITEGEKNEILYEFNDTHADYIRNKTIQELFEDRVAKTPENTALIFKGDSMTYRELNERANQTALILRKKGIVAETLVGLMVERSFEMMIGVYAILKAGGAYIPIDPGYPEDRIRYLFQDSASAILLTQNKFIGIARALEFVGEIIDLNDNSLCCGDTKNLELNYHPEDLAYIIYTSGSTGKPKGVMIEHVSAVNVLMTLDKMYPLEKNDAYLLKTAFLFDVSVSELFGWFWRGGRMAILEPGGEKDPLLMIERIQEEKVTHLNFVPSLFNVFVSMLDEKNFPKLKSLKYIFLAGEAIWPDSILKFRSFNSDILIENLYGPTEATVYASWYHVDQWNGQGSIPIGKPIDNLELYIISNDEQAKPTIQPIGVAGELVVSGIQLARGYLNRPDLTSEKFITNPFAKDKSEDSPYQKMYHTGDLTRWMKNGNVEYMGRIDFQVKVRGFRIELGEIEAQLAVIPNIKEAVVIARESADRQGEKYLCAYLVSNQKLDINSVREALGKELPGYMVPSYFIQLEAIPLNPSGKVDRKALPVPEKSDIETTSAYVAPTNEIEGALASIWSEVLGIEKIGIDDNFFEMGGDSIKTILISARLLKRGLSININQFFSNNTIRKLAKSVRKIERVIDQGVVSGEVLLTPIQKWYFGKDFAQKNHFHHVMSLHSGFRLDPVLLKRVWTKILQHHDALRMSFDVLENEVRQTVKNIDDSALFDFKVFNFQEKNVSPENFNKIIDSVKCSIDDLDNGPLVVVSLFQLPVEDILMIVIHHAIVDGISWRIIIEDLETGYNQIVNGEELKFQNKTDSYKLWAMKLKEYANSNEALKELEFWDSVEKIPVEPLKKDYSPEQNSRKFKNQDVVELLIAKEETEKLLKEAGWPYNTEINDLLLAALAVSIREWSNNNTVAINLEGHGREGIMEDIDISRTVGWFTSQYPVVINLDDIKPDLDNDSVYKIIQKVKETLRLIPNKGIGYGILKYLTAPERKGNVQLTLQPEIIFNYLGQLGE